MGDLHIIDVINQYTLLAFPFLILVIATCVARFDFRG